MAVGQITQKPRAMQVVRNLSDFAQKFVSNQKNSYLCTPFKRTGIANQILPVYEGETYWRDGRVVECGSLENC